MFNEAVTLFCSFGPARAESFQRVVLHGVRLQFLRGATPNDRDTLITNRALLYIPYSSAEGYVSPSVWDKLDATEREGAWTLRPGDVFASDDIGADAAVSPSHLMRQSRAFYITTIAENVGGSLSHFQVGGGHVFHQGGGLS